MQKTIGIFCGSFNPPLNSHFMLAQQIINNNDVDKIIFVPVSSKYNKEGLIEDFHRYNMLKIVCDKNEKFEVSDIEFNLERQPYTIETLQKLKKIYPSCKINLIIGTDNLKELETWHLAEDLVKNFKIIVMARDKDKLRKIINENKFLENNKKSFLILQSNIRTNLNSSFVREEIRKEKSIRYLLPDDVLEYIENNNLYKK